MNKPEKTTTGDQPMTQHALWKMLEKTRTLVSAVPGQTDVFEIGQFDHDGDYAVAEIVNGSTSLLTALERRYKRVGSGPRNPKSR